ncbi:hypothetical protein FQR65_LT06970 [Abscondita terminalis]|nr:hypothetical protein FQR65_LT06970 [Abscondita terminalis]
MMFVKVVCVFVSFCATLVGSARILGITFIPSYSHQTFLRPLWKELLLKGHHLTVLTTEPMNDPSLANLTEIDVQKTNNVAPIDFVKVMDLPLWKLYYKLVQTSEKLVDSQLSNPEVQKLLKNSNKNFDLLIIEGYQSAHLAFSHRFKCPFIFFSTLEAYSLFHYEIGNPTHYALYPDYGLGFPRHLTFSQRLQSLSFNIYYQLLHHYYVIPVQQQLVEKHFGKNYPPIRDVFKNYSIFFLNTNSVIHPVRPLLPNVVQIWGKFLIKNNVTLPKDLQELLDGSTQGAIYFSLGSNVKSEQMSKDILHSIMSAFKELPYTFLWKFENENLQNKPNNVIIAKWFPQQAVLKHPNMKLFITQGGVHSFDEALQAKLPLIGIPIMGDQEANCHEITFKGLGLMLKYKSITKYTLKSTILEVINNPKYKNNVKIYSELATDQQQTGLERAVWWTDCIHTLNMMYAKVLFVCISISCCVVGVQSARILGVSVLLSYSHQTFLRPLWKELLLRGHHLTVLTHQPMNDPLLTNLTEINLKKTNSQLKLANFIELMDVPSWILHYRFAEKFGKLIDSQLSNPKVQNLINDPNENFDLLIIEGYHTAYLAFSHRFKCPFISVITLEAFAHIHYEIGNPTHYALYPDYELGFSRHLTFFQRFQSLSYDIYYQLLLHYFTVPTQQRLVEKHFGINYPSIREIFKNYSICFLNSNSVIHPVRPLLPNVVQIWGKFHINKRITNLLDRSTQGAIYFSLGSNVESRDMSNEILRSILKAFEELPYTILWKFEHDNLQNIPDNVVISKWFPQQDVLRHPNMKLFITQGGVHSFEEALNANLPLIGIPIMGDQKANCQELTFKGLGVMLEYKSITKDIFKSAILEVINNPKYKNAVKFYAQLATDQPETGLERAVWWTEYVLRHKGHPTHYALHPDYMLPFQEPLTFIQQLESLHYSLYLKYLNYNYVLPSQQRLVEKHFGKDYPLIQDIFKNYSIFFLNSNSILHPIRPLLPNVVQIWGKNHITNNKPLPTELEKVMNKSSNGVIYFSLGSNVKSKDISSHIMQAIIAVFKELPYTVLWKFEDENLPNKPDNVITSKWFPQQDILRHPNIILFITQGGLQSFEEALEAQVPLLGIPVMGDQKTNVQRIANKGLGMMLEYKYITKDSFKSALIEVITNPKYRKTVKMYAELVKDQPSTGLERAVWWTEYVLRHKGAPHLRNPAYDLAWYQYYYLDVIAFCLAVVVILIYCTFALIRMLTKHLVRFVKEKET